jgi:Ala-tRNA(Pro) deacylase
MAMSAIQAFLEQRGVPFESLSHPRAFTSISEARALGIPADEVLKTVVLDAGEGHVLAVVPGGRRLDMRLVHDAIGDSHAALASEQELQRDFPEYELGAFPPLGELIGAPVYVDPEVLEHDMVVFAAGTCTESIKARSRDLFPQGSVTVAPITRHPEWDDDKEQAGLG